ncbi:hypothetical protein AJ78_02130 [Emergomyces pasteurianus Ep9510]|uniref:AB hydrolase-1 domain-containing protein n=1 Tax=Emergomyces pasteurianus Ep9510 TaxID=1447872 RepID=A0A1J9PPG0_9EURO|nr:hypothetical protein AJ78_02130 [Emergomyces pasteurianus Ep9510]
MEPLVQKTFTTSRSFTYSYYISPSSPQTVDTLPPLLLLHGFPDGPILWRPLLPYLLTLPHCLIIPALLGYHPTSSPLDPTAYNSKGMADDLAELLTAESISTVIAIGHDWGSFLASRVYVWHPERVVGLALLNVAYIPPEPTKPMSLEEMHAIMEKVVGYPTWAYWDLFTGEDGAAVVGGNLERCWEAMHADRPQPEWMRQLLCTKGALREFLTTRGGGGDKIELREYAKEGGVYKEDFFKRMTNKEAGGIGPALCWYRAHTEHAYFEVEKTLDKEASVLKVPTLFVACPGDAVCRPEFIQGPVQKGLLPDLTVIEVKECGHWGLIYEKAEETAGVISGFLKERFQPN